MNALDLKWKKKVIDRLTKFYSTVFFFFFSSLPCGKFTKICFFSLYFLIKLSSQTFNLLFTNQNFRQVRNDRIEFRRNNFLISRTRLFS